MAGLPSVVDVSDVSEAIDVLDESEVLDVSGWVLTLVAGVSFEGGLLVLVLALAVTVVGVGVSGIADSRAGSGGKVVGVGRKSGSVVADAVSGSALGGVDVAVGDDDAVVFVVGPHPARRPPDIKSASAPRRKGAARDTGSG